MDTKSKILATLALIFIGLGLLFVFANQGIGKLRIIACDVGQGDGLLVISPRGKQIVVDGGPGKKIIDCLSQKMPFWDRTVEMVVLTHPQKDHLEGLLEILARYRVELVATTGIAAQTGLFESWQEALTKEGAKIYQPVAGDRLLVDGVEIEILWPTLQKLELWKLAPSSDLNETSVVMRVSFDRFCAYLTGDVTKEILQGLINKQCQVLKIAHHGSKTGTSEAIVNQVEPDIAVIQVGKNSFGHPHQEVIDLTKSKGVRILRNDINGTVEIQTDGQSLEIKTEK